MSNPFKTALNTLHAASEIAGIDKNAVMMLNQPKRVFEFTIPMKMDNGEFRIFNAYRVHYNDALGQTKNGVRFVPDLDLDTVKALGFWMTIKHAIAGIPAGGGKGGIKVNPKELSEWELERLTRAFMRKLPMKGAWVDIPGADIGTSAKTQAWMLDEYEEISGFHSPAAVNDKPIEVNGTLGSMEATGTGAFFVAKEVIRDTGITKGASIAVQGFGNVGRIISRLLYQEGYKIVAVSDIMGGIYANEGINIEKLEMHVDETGYVVGLPGAERITNQQLIEINCDILIPAAVQSVITEENAGNIKAKMVLECANGPTTPGGERILEERGVLVVPDVLANCGSAIVCSFERTQGLTDTYWSLEEVIAKLEKKIVKAYRETVVTAKEKNTSLRNGAWVNALIKIAKSMKARGWI